MVKLVAMFNLPPGTSESDFEKYFTNKHVKEASNIPGLRKYTIGKAVGNTEGKPSWYRINELWFDSMDDAKKALSSQIAVDCTNDLSPRVEDFVGVFIEEEEVKLPS